MNKEIVSRFKLGFAPDDWNGFAKGLKSEELNAAEKAGLVVPRKSGGYYDRFRNRIMFPISDVRGRIIGFGGRVLDHAMPKYLNTPESILFHKGQVLYGLQASNEEIRKSGRAVIVEGYMDLLALQRHGFSEAVATLGTALTRDHVRLLRGYAREVVVVFDSDTAGKAAASKAFLIFLNEEFPAKAVLLPEGEDPDNFVNKRGLPAFLDLLDCASPIFDFFLDLQITQTGHSIEGRIAILKQTIPLLCELKNAAQQSLYVKRISEKLDLHESSVLEEMKKWISSSSRKEERTRAAVAPSDKKPMHKDDAILLNILVHHPSTIEGMLKEDLRLLLTDEAVKEIFDRLGESHGKGKPITLSELPEKLGDQGRELLREALVSRSICAHEEEVALAIKEYERKVLQIKLSESKKKAEGRSDFEELNRISQIKREKWG